MILRNYQNDIKLAEPKTYNAKVIFYTYMPDADTALVTFEPDWRPNFFPIAPIDYKYKEGKPGPIWDLMGNGGTSVPGLLGWHRFVLNWLGENEVVCLDKEKGGSFEQTLKPLNSKVKGNKLLITPISSTQALAVEVRRQSSFDKLTANETGVLVYLIDVTKGDDQGIITIITSKNTKKEDQILGSLKPGDKVSYKGITIQVNASGKSSDTIKVIS